MAAQKQLYKIHMCSVFSPADRLYHYVIPKTNIWERVKYVF